MKFKIVRNTAIGITAFFGALSISTFEYAICRKKKRPDVRRKKKWKPYLDFVLKEQNWIKRHKGRRQEILSADGLKLRAMYIPRKNAKGIIICMHGY